jgi:hypothetical protein
MKKFFLGLSFCCLAFSANAQIKAGDDAQTILNEALRNMTARRSPSPTPATDTTPTVATAPASTAQANDVWDFMQIPMAHKETVIPTRYQFREGDSRAKNAAYKIWTTKNHETILAYLIMQEGGNRAGYVPWDDLFQALTLRGEVWTLAPGMHVFLERTFPDGTGIVTWTDRGAKSHTTYVAMKDLKPAIQ